MLYWEIIYIPYIHPLKCTLIILLYGYTFSFFITNLWTFFNIMSNAAENICHKPFVSPIFFFCRTCFYFSWMRTCETNCWITVPSFACFPFGLSFKKNLVFLKNSITLAWWELGGMRATVRVSSLFYPVDYRDWTQLFKLGGRHRFLLNRSLALCCLLIIIEDVNALDTVRFLSFIGLKICRCFLPAVFWLFWCVLKHV